jgi:thiol-disulfide isomerase/thioredoxin
MENGSVVDTLATFTNIDTAFVFEMELPQPKIICVNTDKSRYPFKLICEKGECRLKLGQGGTYNYQGGALQQAYSKIYRDSIYKMKQALAMQFAKSIPDLYSEKNYQNRKKLSSMYKEADKRLNYLMDSLRYLNPVNAYIVTKKKRDFGSNAAKTMELINKLDKEYYKAGIEAANQIYKQKCEKEALERKNGIGKQIQNFRLLTPDGKQIDFHEVIKQNKYTMLEFWASWCFPCRQEIPFLKKDYKHFKDKGFEIISFSLDKDEQKWKKAIDKHEIKWINVRNQDDIAGEYGVKAIPRNFIVDKDGIIVAKNLRGDDVEAFLDKVLH